LSHSVMPTPPSASFPARSPMENSGQAHRLNGDKEERKRTSHKKRNRPVLIRSAPTS
jgi:hypothetical protein